MTQLPPTQRRVPAPIYPKRVRPKTYTVAVYLVGAIVLLQVGMLISVFWLRAMIVSVSVQVPKALVKGPTQPPLGPIAPSPLVPPDTEPKISRLPSLTMTNSRPTLLSVPGMNDDQEQVSTLNEEAQILLHQNDLKHAVKVLTRAEDIDPQNPTTLKNLAITYYLMNDSVRTKNYWQRLVDLGPDVGPVYALAKDHVALMETSPDSNPLSQSSRLARKVYIDLVEKTPVETTGGQPQFHLRTVLMRKNPELDFDQKKLQPYVIFYQKTDDGQLVPDLSQHKGAFDDTFLFWSDKRKEPFGVDYLMPTPGSPNFSNGKYYGFIIGIYYNKTLQDVRSEPADLMQRIPLPIAIE